MDKTEAQPAETVQVTVSATPQSTAYLLAVDQSVLLLKSGNDITAGQVGALEVAAKVVEEEVVVVVVVVVTGVVLVVYCLPAGCGPIRSYPQVWQRHHRRTSRCGGGSSCRGVGGGGGGCCGGRGRGGGWGSGVGVVVAVARYLPSCF